MQSRGSRHRGKTRRKRRLTEWAEGLSLVIIRKAGEVEEEIGIRETDRQIQPES
jgi:hypothetical protein